MKEIHDPSEIRKLSIKELKALAEEIRGEIIQAVSEHGGHLASNLGTVELTLALHYVFDTPEDKIVFDVGHQAYTHKLLTGRLKGFERLREAGGVSGFPQPDESEYDAFTAGHASTAISAALGMARARDIMKGHNDVIAVVGDGALSGGMCYEALNDAGHSKTPMIVVLNDNEMSISKSVGAMSRYLTSLRQSHTYGAVKSGIRTAMTSIPVVGKPIYHVFRSLRNAIRSLLLNDRFFSVLGFKYMGPIDGHDLKHLIRVLKKAKHTQRPLLLHVVTQKGHGYELAENHPEAFHGMPPFYVESGETRSNDAETSCGAVACRTLAEMADSDIRICGITAAMPSGTGMEGFAHRHPDRFFDVGITEEHAVEMAGGLAAGGMHPYVAIYSTFLQRAYDQMLSDICRSDMPVTFLLDRSGLVGADGKTHQGVFDISYLRSMPNMVICAPKDNRELKEMVRLSARVDAPMAIRYPKSLEDLGAAIVRDTKMRVGTWELISGGTDVMLLAVGRCVQSALQASVLLMRRGISAGVINARFIKPMDCAMLTEWAKKTPLVTIEENVLSGGFGEGVERTLIDLEVPAKVHTLGVPDRFIGHGSVRSQLRACGLDAEGIADRVSEWLGKRGDH